MKKVRMGVFETNSSSTHSICIAKNIEYTLPTSLHFEPGDFGWMYETLKSVKEKASYLYTGLKAEQREADINKIVKLLETAGVEVTVSSEESGYVDHSDGLTRFLNDVCSDKEKLFSFLFSDLSFIITGNDNDRTDVSINVSYPYDEYHKNN